MSLGKVIYPDGPLDLYLDVDAHTAVVVADLVTPAPDITGNTATGGTEDRSALSTNLGSFCKSAEGKSCHLQPWLLCQRAHRERG